MLIQGKSYEEVTNAFSWNIPEYFNMGVAVCDRHCTTNGSDTALIVEQIDGAVNRYSFQDIKNISNQFANLFKQSGVQIGDRVGVLLSQSVEAAATHVASWKSGFISIPLFTLFREEALEFRLSNSGARALITDRENYKKITPLRKKLPELKYIFIIDGNVDDTIDLYNALENASDQFSPLNTKAEDPALIIYTSGTTGNPKGALHAHRVLLGHIPSCEFSHEFPKAGEDLFWTPADWAWIAGLMNVLMGAWYNRIPVLAYRARKYDPEAALSLMERHGVRDVFMPPTALKMMRQVDNIKQRYSLKLRTIASGGEPMGEELLDWGRREFGITVNEYYGQTECNLVASNCAVVMTPKPGSMGKPVPGQDVRIINEFGEECSTNEIGDICVKSPHPIMFLQYWDNIEATKKKFRGPWLVMGDRGFKDEDGYLFFFGRDDDVISSAGYRIGPSEIEDCLTKHEAVAMAAVIGVPDPIRTEAVKAFITLRDEFEPCKELEISLRDFVKNKLSPHEYPRHIDFVDQLPLTATGKIKRKDLRDAEIAKIKKEEVST